MRYVGKLYRPPSEARSYILQATIGCSWNKCTYCDMYRDKPVFRVRSLSETLEDIREAGQAFGDRVEKVFVADGDALVLERDTFVTILEACRQTFPRLRQISCYATAQNVLEKSDDDLRALQQAGLHLLYMGPESGDDRVLKRVAKGVRRADFEEAARRAKKAGYKLSAIFLLGAGGVELSQEHARASAQLATAMDPDYLAALTLTIVPGTPLARLHETSRFELPSVQELILELRTFVDEARPTSALFRTNHASNYLPIGGTLPKDGPEMVRIIDEALAGKVFLRPEKARGL
jgi:radical SAM superfamily enzyme YgiQ (UPF0313 family)